MQRQKIEAWALSIFDNVSSGKKVEDTFVELKSIWPEDIYKAARRIAGHANSARGEPILWIIGLSEDNGVCSFDQNEMATWWPKVKSFFYREIAPAIANVLVNTEKGPIMALLFDTSEGPFLIKNPKFGLPDSGPIQWETTWREGTSVRSATREDLLRLLVPMQPLPSIEILTAFAQVSLQENDTIYDNNASPIRKKPHLEWSFTLWFYVTPKDEKMVVLPIHRTKLQFQIVSEGEKTQSSIESHYYAHDSETTKATIAEAIASGPGEIGFRSSFCEIPRELPQHSSLKLFFKVKPASTEILISKTIQLELEQSSPRSLTWAFRKDSE